MDYLRKLGKLYNQINPATLSGAIDVLVVKQADGSFRSSPFHVRFGKINLLRPSGNVVEVKVNGKRSDLAMRVGPLGEAFFVSKEPEEDHFLSASSMTPLQADADLLKREDSSNGSAAVSSAPGESGDSEKPLSAESTNETSGRPGVESHLQLQYFKSLGADLEADEEDEEIFYDPEFDFPQWSSVPSPGTSRTQSISEDPLEVGKTRVSVTTPTNLDEPARGGTPVPTSRADLQPSSPRRDGAAASTTESAPLQAPARQLTSPTQSRWTFPSLAAIDSNVSTTSAEISARSTDSHRQRVASMSSEVSDVDAVEMSLCGGLNVVLGPGEMEDQFNRNMITYQQFCDNPLLTTDPNLVVRVNNRYFNWSVIGPLLLCQAVFNKPLSEKSCEKLVETSLPKKQAKGSWWFHWGRGNPTQASASQVAGAPADKSAKADAPLVSPTSLPPSNPASNPASGKSSPPFPLAPPVPPPSLELLAKDDPIAPVPLPLSSENSIKKPGFVAPPWRTAPSDYQDQQCPIGQRHVKSIRLNSSQLEQLDLKEGQNHVEFSVITRLQGRATVSCNVYLWNHDVKVVVSDIDGTITKSDVMGHAATFFGRDWTHSGVANLFSKIEKNGYKFLYLSSRGISYAEATREYLRNIKQEHGSTLPDGPVFLYPESLMAAIRREIIEKKPQEFKIACLTDVMSLFTSHGQKESPFSAGFGNRVTDEITYKAVGVASARIFTIDPKSQVKMPAGQFTSSYVKLNEIVDQFFPPINLQRGMKRDFNEFSYWRPPIAAVVSDEDLKNL
eukprot:m.484758 g.484758  ORF g.484758 m.484758 type:complete len:787 (-) comp57204_c0_seq4:21-2381(-)